MPCSKYKGKQRKACYATNEWSSPVKKRKTTRKKTTRRKKK